MDIAVSSECVCYQNWRLDGGEGTVEKTVDRIIASTRAKFCSY